jgi:arylsulfatase
VEVGRADYPPEWNGNPIKPMEGISLTTSFAGQPLNRRAIFWEHEGNRAVRLGDWKLVAKGPMKDRELPVNWELYNISTDRNEMDDLSKNEPVLRQQLIEMWTEYARRAEVYPCPKPASKAAPRDNPDEGDGIK